MLMIYQDFHKKFHQHHINNIRHRMWLQNNAIKAIPGDAVLNSDSESTLSDVG